MRLVRGPVRFSLSPNQNTTRTAGPLHRRMRARHEMMIGQSILHPSITVLTKNRKFLKEYLGFMHHQFKLCVIVDRYWELCGMDAQMP